MYDLHVNILPMKYPLVMYVHFDAQYTVKAAQWYVTKKLVLLYKKKETEMIYFLSQISWLIIGLLDLVEKNKDTLSATASPFNRNSSFHH